MYQPRYREAVKLLNKIFEPDGYRKSLKMFSCLLRNLILRSDASHLLLIFFINRLQAMNFATF